MPRNKNAMIRYRTIDRCLSNWSRRFYIEDLINECADALSDYTGSAVSISKRQILEDLRYMEDREGWSAPIERKRDGHKVYYKYSDKRFSIVNQPMTQDERRMIRDALALLSKFDGVPQFEWLTELDERLEVAGMMGAKIAKAVSFQSNPYLKGMEHFRQAFYSILNKRAVRIAYEPFGAAVRTIVVSPYYLKQYNNRWFLIGKRNDYHRLSNYALDRVISMEETTSDFEACEIDFEDYFADVVGVSVRDIPAEKVVLKVDETAAKYIMTKPLHPSQEANPVKSEDGNWLITLKRVQDNYELRSLLMSFGDSVEVIEPSTLRDEMGQIVEAMCKKYKD